MKFLACLLLFAVIQQNECKPTISDMRSAESLCLKELNFDMTQVPNMSNFEKETEDNENYRKMYSCLFKKIGILNVKGEISEAGFDNFVEILMNSIGGSADLKKLSSNVLQQCRTLEGESGGEIGLKMKNCIRTAGLEFRQKVKDLSSNVV